MKRNWVTELLKTLGVPSGSMIIKMEDMNNSGMPVQFIGHRSRLSSCTGVKLIDEKRLICTNMVGQRMYLVRYDFSTGHHEIEDCIPTKFGEQDVCTDLIDGDGRGRFATSNCNHASLSIYSVSDNRMKFDKDLPIPEKEPGFCHGVKFMPPNGEIICATTTMKETSVYFLRVESGEIVYKIRDGEWRPKDVCFFDDSRIIVIYTQGTPSFNEAAPYHSKVSLIALDLAWKNHKVIKEYMVSGHVDCCRFFGERVYVTNGSRDCVMVFKLGSNGLTLESELSGYFFPHGIDLLAGLLAVTNYGSNTVILTQTGSP